MPLDQARNFDTFVCAFCHEERPVRYRTWGEVIDGAHQQYRAICKDSCAPVVWSGPYRRKARALPTLEPWIAA